MTQHGEALAKVEDQKAAARPAVDPVRHDFPRRRRALLDRFERTVELAQQDSAPVLEEGYRRLNCPGVAGTHDQRFEPQGQIQRVHVQAEAVFFRVGGMRIGVFQQWRNWSATRSTLSSG